jgi:hypothetical protein
LIAVGALCSLAAIFAQAPAGDPVLRAMHDEIERSRKLTLSSLEAPYFIEYVIDEGDTFGVSASLGGVLSRRRDRFRSPSVHVRVGDYKFDNGNYTGSGFMFGSRYDLERFPIEDSYPVLRRYLWLATDTAYKSAVEAISRKRAALRNLTQSEQIADFAHAEPVHFVHDFKRLAVDEDVWTSRVRALSAAFAQYPELRNSSVDLEASEGGYYIANSEGTEVKEPESVTFLRMRAQAQAPDGMVLRDALTYHALDAARMPSDAEMNRGVKTLAESVIALAHAPRGEDYSGPVMFEGAAGAQIFAEVLGKNLALARRPVSDGGRGGGGFSPSELEGRLGARVLPESFDVVDDPTQKEWRGRPLFGSYDVDREGVSPKPLKLVEKSVLKGYLMTRQPVRGFEGSNGRARTPGSYGAAAAGVGNLFVSSSDTMTVGEMKKKLLELIQTRGKPYGLIVRRMDFPSSGSVEEARRLLAGNQGGRPVSLPLLVYRIYPDGREELVRGLRFRNFNARSLKDILAAGDDPQTFEYLDSPAPFALIGAAGFTSEACVVAPSILIDDLELHPLEEEMPKLPIVPAPEITR